MKQVIWLLVALLIIFHQDFWNWESDTRIFLGLPVGLVYHAGLSLAAAAVWALACRFAWPKDLDVPAPGSGEHSAGGPHG